LFQYYDLRRLWADTQVALDSGLVRLNLATPPVSSARVAMECFGTDISGQVVSGTESPFASMYTRDMQTRYADLFDGPRGYLMDERAELAALRDFVVEARTGRSPDAQNIEAVGRVR